MHITTHGRPPSTNHGHPPSVSHGHPPSVSHGHPSSNNNNSHTVITVSSAPGHNHSHAQAQPPFYGPRNIHTHFQPAPRGPNAPNVILNPHLPPGSGLGTGPR